MMMCKHLVLLFSFLLQGAFLSYPKAHADHFGPHKIVDGKYVAILLLTPEKEAMKIRFLFRDIKTGKNLPGSLFFNVRVHKEKSPAFIFKSPRLEAVNGKGEIIYTFPRDGLYEVYVEFERPEEPGKIYRPASWPLWVPGKIKDTSQQYPIGLTEISGFSLLFLSIGIIIFNLWQKKRGRLWDIPFFEEKSNASHSSPLQKVLSHTGPMIVAMGVGIIIGFFIYPSFQKKGTLHAAHSMHGQIDLLNEKSLPTVKLMVTKDTMSGWNLKTMTTNFLFSPENVGGKHVPGEGHAHLFVNGKKITRLYGEWYYLSNLPLGKHEIRVTLNANNHDRFFYKGKPIEDVEILEIS